MQGDFSHRIEVSGKDQLAELGGFLQPHDREPGAAVDGGQGKGTPAVGNRNRARGAEPAVPASGSADQVSAPDRGLPRRRGSYPATITISRSPRDRYVALAIGDVAGKGISAALLMATLQSSLRTQLNNGKADEPPSAARLVSQLNQYLYANTSAEKFSTLCLGLFDEADGSFIYTNGGNVPPALLRGGVVQRLDVNGTVVGAFPYAEYGESRIVLEPGDLLVFFTDGVTEPENAYGEMFGEERFLDLLVRNAHLGEEEIVRTVIESVREWTGSEELQDDMTLLLARRV